MKNKELTEDLQALADRTQKLTITRTGTTAPINMYGVVRVDDKLFYSQELFEELAEITFKDRRRGKIHAEVNYWLPFILVPLAVASFIWLLNLTPWLHTNGNFETWFWLALGGYAFSKSIKRVTK